MIHFQGTLKITETEAVFIKTKKKPHIYSNCGSTSKTFLLIWCEAAPSNLS